MATTTTSSDTQEKTATSTSHSDMPNLQSTMMSDQTSSDTRGMLDWLQPATQFAPGSRARGNQQAQFLAEVLGRGRLSAAEILKIFQGENPALNSYMDMIKNLISFFGPEIPNSVSADKEGLATAEFLRANADLVTKVDKQRNLLEEKTKHHLGCCGLEQYLHKLDIKMTMFKNWANTLDTGLMLYAKPQNVLQVSAVIKAAGEMDPIIKVGFGGSYHSWSPLFPEKCKDESMSIILNMCDLHLHPTLTELAVKKRIRLVKDDNDSITHVTIVPGVTTGELMEVFLDEGVCFESDVILMGVTYGGVIPTGCHGVGKDQKLIADWVSQIKIVNCKGEIKNYPNDLPDIDKDLAMRAIKTSMGIFGAIVEMTIKVEKLKTAKINTSYPTIGSLLYGDSPALPQILRDNWSVEILWFPFNSLNLIGGMMEGLPLINNWQPKTDEVWVRVINRDDSYCEANKMDKLQQKIADTLQHQAMGSILNPVIDQFHTLTPALLSTSLNLIKKENPPGISYEPMPYGIHFRYGITLGPVYDMEFGFPFNLKKKDDHHEDESFQKLMTAMKFVVEKSKEYTLRGCGLLPEFPMSTTMELRVIEKSDTLICPASRRPNDSTTHTAYLEILSFTGTSNYQEFFKEVGQKWMELGGAPHWCKQWTFLEHRQCKEDRNVFNHIRDFYGQNLIDYCNVFDALSRSAGSREQQEIFMNSTMKKLFRP